MSMSPRLGSVRIDYTLTVDYVRVRSRASGERRSAPLSITYLSRSPSNVEDIDGEHRSVDG